MFRRPLMVRRSPGIIGTVARTAAIAGTAMVTSHAIAGHYQKQEVGQEAAFEAAESSAQIADLQSQIAHLQANQAQQSMTDAGIATSPADGSLTQQLTQLSQLKEAGVLTSNQFEEAKERLLAG